MRTTAAWPTHLTHCDLANTVVGSRFMEAVELVGTQIGVGHEREVDGVLPLVPRVYDDQVLVGFECAVHAIEPDTHDLLL